jgi:hypothetical protein
VSPRTFQTALVYLHAFLTSAIVGGELWTSRPGRFIPVLVPGLI